YLTTVVTDTSAIQQVEFLETGTRLIVRPFVGANDHVRLEIHPEDSNGQVAPVEEGGPALPRKTTSEVTTNIIVRDGKTVVIAGLFRDQVQTTRRQVPLLGDIPWMGTLFRSTVDTTTRSEVIVLITPHIIRDTSAEAVGERMRGVAERYRIGARQGLRWWGRNRLSANYLKWANQAWTEGDLEKARWWLDLCLSLQPDLVEAMLLKERMTDEAGWANPPQFTDARFIVTRMLMQEIGRDVDTVLPPRRPLHDGDLTPEVRKALGVELKPTTSGVIRREENYVPVRRGNSSVPGAVDMVPATAAPPKDQVSPKPKPSKPETAPKKPDKPTPPVMKTKPAKKPEPVKTPKPKPAELKSAKKAEPKPAETRKPKPAPTKPAVKPEPTQPKPAEQPKPKVEPKPETKPKPAEKPKPKVEAKPEEQPKSEETPKPAPQPAPSKEPESSGEPRPAPIQDQPVAPTPDPNVSPSAVRAKPAPKPAEPVKISSPPPLSDTLESEATPEKKSETQTKQPSAEPRKESPKPKSNHRQPLEEYKSPAQQHLDSGTLSALLKQSAADTNRKTATR
ncbi:MAG: hypothetical protein JXA11_04885, partial [Phycisphaerae bacterium]|nr:hypothetical protein [Phycisphaerae bacterium]